ncbi:MAG: YceI family protein [Pseudomonadota bacterium]
MRLALILLACLCPMTLLADTAPPIIPPEPTVDGSPPASPPAPESLGLPARTWQADPAHASLTFSVSHLGFSRFNAGFDTFAATLVLDPAAPEEATLTVTVDVASIDLPTPPEGFYETMLGLDWFDAATYPDMVYTSSSITRTGPDTARIDGTLAARGTEVPVTLQARFNGGYPSSPFEPFARVGFSATGTVSRSALGMGFGVPAPGTTFGVGDAVRISTEVEFIAEPVE